MPATVSASYMRTVSDAINALSGSGQRALRAKLEALIAEGGYEDPFELVDAAMSELEPLFESIAQSSASLSATSYDMLRTVQLGEGIGAQPYPDRAQEWTRKALYGIAKDHRDNIDAFVSGVCQRLDYEAKRAAGSTMFVNGARDPNRPRFARVPTGPETCPFCIMLASRGFVYLSEDSAGKLDHYHSDCDCRVVPQFGDARFEGYDPDEYYDQYQKLLDDETLDPGALARSAVRAKLKKRAASRTKRRSTFRKIHGPHSKDYDTTATNPHYGQGIGWEVNCQRCVPTYIARRRGYDVVAKPATLNGNDPMGDISGNWTKVYGGATFNDFTKCGGNTVREQLNNVENYMRKCGDGSMAVVYIQWATGDAHVFISERDGGKTVYRDPQRGKRRCKSYFAFAKTGDANAVAVMRVDDKNLTSLINECCENRI